MTGNQLYNRGGIIITSTGEGETHNAYVGDPEEFRDCEGDPEVFESYLYIGRGILRDWAEAEPERVRSGICRLDPRNEFAAALAKREIIPTRFHRAIMQARIKELEKERDDALYFGR